MTKELQNAIRHIKTRSDAWAVKVIEDALEQEPCEEDAISREAVLDILEDTDNGWIINEVEQLPSVQPKPIECEDAISRAEVLDQLDQSINILEATDRIKAMSSVQPSRKVIEDIKAEIEALDEGITSYHNDKPWVYKHEVLEIIDKHISGKENG